MSLIHRGEYAAGIRIKFEVLDSVGGVSGPDEQLIVGADPRYPAARIRPFEAVRNPRGVEAQQHLIVVIGSRIVAVDSVGDQNRAHTLEIGHYRYPVDPAASEAMPDSAVVVGIVLADVLELCDGHDPA